MRFVAQAIAQAKELLLSLSPAMRLVAGLLLVTVLVGLWLLFFAPWDGGGHFLLGGRTFNASEITAAEKAFGQAGLKEARVEGNRIRVPPGQESAYVAAMAAEGALPADFGEILEKTLEKVNPFMSPSQRDELIKSARERELAGIIRAMPDMESAAVTFDRRRAPGISRQDIVVASVTLWPKAGSTIDQRRLKAIRQLLVKSVAGLKPEDVFVQDAHGGAFLAEGHDDGSETTPYLSAMRGYQRLYENNVRTALAFVPNVQVTATVELSKELESSQEIDNVSEKNRATLRETEKIKQSSTDSSPGGGGPPGLEAQSVNPNRRASLTGGGPTATRAKTSSDKIADSMREFQPGHDIKRMRFVGLTPKSVSVAVSVPSTYFEDVWSKEKEKSESAEPPRQPPLLEQVEDREKAKIELAVAGAIPLPEDKTAVKPRVTVTSFAFVPPPQPPLPPVTEKTVGWLSRNWTTVALLGLVVFSLLMLRSLVRSLPVPESAPQHPVAKPEEPRSEPAAEATRRAVRREPATASLRDELTTMVREDPETAASVIRGWIGSAG
jgi:flagellar M-ring protein FliF